MADQLPPSSPLLQAPTFPRGPDYQGTQGYRINVRVPQLPAASPLSGPSLLWRVRCLFDASGAFYMPIRHLVGRTRGQVALRIVFA
jgi:hypothetical protein